MRAMILAAGRGERLRPLTDTVPKPLIQVQGKALIVHHIERLAAAGITELVINVSYLAEQIKTSLQDGAHFGVNIQYSEEPSALETAGGICQALPLLGDAPFLVINADVWTDYPFERLTKPLAGLAHLVLVDNPPEHPEGDFYYQDRKVVTQSAQKLTFSGIGCYHPKLFSDLKPEKQPLPPLLRQHTPTGEIHAEHYHGQWQDIGTPERLQQVEHSQQK